MRHADWAVVDVDDKRGIVFLEDLDGTVTVTNDAENVVHQIKRKYGHNYRIVYKDTEGEWWEITSMKTWMGERADFKPWYGSMWDVLKHEN